MKVLSVHNYYQQGGGEDRSFEAEVSLLREFGHDVVTYIRHNDEVNQLSKIRVALGTTWSRRARQEVRAILKKHKPEVMHCTNIFPLISPSIYSVAQRERTAVVQSLRNYRLICVNSSFYRNGKVCEACLVKKSPLSGVIGGCYRGSRAASLAVATNVWSHKKLGTWKNKVDQFFTPSEFTREKYIEAGLSASKIAVKPNFLESDPGLGCGSGNYALFVGRLAPEKGVDTLIEAWNEIGERLPLRIVGDGPDRQMVQRAAQQNPAITWEKEQSLNDVYELMKGATLVVVPSRWYETFGRVIMEAFACGTPVLVSRLGAMQELLGDESCGRFFEHSDSRSLSTELLKMLANPQQLAEMKIAAREAYLRLYTPAENHRQLINIYEMAIAKRLESERRTSKVRFPIDARA